MPSIRKPAARGYSLVELLIVIIVLALLVAVALLKFVYSSDEAKPSNTDSSMVNLRWSLNFDCQRQGRYPSSNTATKVAGAGDAGTGVGKAGAQAVFDQMSLNTCTKRDTYSTKKTTFQFDP